MEEYGIEWGSALGITVRTWRSEHEGYVNYSNRAYNYETYEKAIREEMSVSGIETIFISCDNEESEKEYMKLLLEYPGKRVLRCEKKEGEEKIVNVITKMLLLSKCGRLICNRISTYSECVYWLSGCKQKVKALF